MNYVAYLECKSQKNTTDVANGCSHDCMFSNTPPQSCKPHFLRNSMCFDPGNGFVSMSATIISVGQ